MKGSVKRSARLGALGVLLAATLAPSAAPAAKIRLSPCMASLSQPPAQPVAGAYLPAIVQHFAVLARPMTSQDALPAAERPGSVLQGTLSKYYPQETRLLGTGADGSRVYLLPGYLAQNPIAPARCLSPSQRRDRRHLVAQQRARSRVPVFCLISVRVAVSSSSYNGNCLPFSSIASGAQFIVPAPGSPARAALIPDGVATVDLSYSDGEAQRLPVTGNTVVVSPPARLRRSVAARLRRFEREAKRLAGAQGSAPPTAAQVRRLRRLATRLEAILQALQPRTVTWIDAGGHTVLAAHPRLGAGGDSAGFSGGSQTSVASGPRPKP